MAVSGVSSSVNVYVPQPPAAKVANPSPTAAATVTTSTPSVVAATPSSPTPPAAAPASPPSPAATAPAAAPKVDAIKLAIKESNEPIALLTQQARQGDVVAKLLLKQITQKAAAKEALAAKPQSAAVSDGPEGTGKGELVDHKA
jgi:hypothetical protein